VVAQKIVSAENVTKNVNDKLHIMPNTASLKPIEWVKLMLRLHLAVLTTRNETWRL